MNKTAAHFAKLARAMDSRDIRQALRNLTAPADHAKRLGLQAELNRRARIIFENLAAGAAPAGR